MCLCQHESCYDRKHNFREITVIIVGVLFLLKTHDLLVLIISSLHRLSSGFLNVLEVLKHDVKIGLGTGQYFAIWTWAKWSSKCITL